MEEKHTLYFAYGSNMDLKHMARQCPGARMAGKAILAHYRFIFNETGYATIVPSEGHQVEGVLWRLLPEHDRTLDDYEDHFDGFYDRCHREVVNGRGEKRMALVYIDHRQTAVSPPNPGYLERVIDGAIENGLAESYIEILRDSGVDG